MQSPRCLNCNSNLIMNVSLDNVFSTLGLSIRGENIEIDAGKLITKGVVILGKKFVCERCGNTVSSLDDIGLRCDTSGKFGPISDFRIVKTKSQRVSRFNRSYIVHESMVDELIKDFEKGGYEVKVYKPNLKVNLEGFEND